MDAALLAAAGLTGAPLRRFAKSFTNEVYLVEGRSLVLPVMQNPTKRETDLAVARLLAQHGLPVPTITRAGQVGDRASTPPLPGSPREPAVPHRDRGRYRVGLLEA